MFGQQPAKQQNRLTINECMNPDTTLVPDCDHETMEETDDEYVECDGYARVTLLVCLTPGCHFQTRDEEEITAHLRKCRPRRRDSNGTRESAGPAIKRRKTEVG